MSSSSPQISGLIVGARKCGTTWLYENFRNDPQFKVSEKVKESGYFAGNAMSDSAAYEALLEGATGDRAIEVDTSVCYAPDAADRIINYNPQMHIVLILRDPAAYLTSRYTHSLRKGELDQADPLAAFNQTSWLRQELDYSALIAKFDTFRQTGQLTVLPFELLKQNPASFYDIVATALGGTAPTVFTPSLIPVNVARNARFAWVSRLLSDGAKLSRALGAHRLVNMLKGTGVLKFLEQPAETVPLDMDELNTAIEQANPGTLASYRAICEAAGLAEV